MDKNEVITLSSDEECDVSQEFQNLNTSKTLKPELRNSPEVLKACLEKFKGISLDRNKGVIIHNKKHEVQIVRLSKLPEKKAVVVNKECPEVVDLEGNSANTVEGDQGPLHCTNDKSLKSDKNHSNLEIIDIVEVPSEDNLANDKLATNAVIKEDVSNDTINCNSKPKNPDKRFETETLIKEDEKSSDQNLKFFTEFVEYCSCLEEIPSDRARLTKKLMKRYGEADCLYIKSQEFQNLIKKCRNNVNKNNLYLIAKEIADELSYRKKKESNTGKSNVVEGNCQRNQQTVENTETPKLNNQKSKKQTKVIKKIVKKLDKLGCKIRELEEKEVDLSDEEESCYVQLQRHRERFWQIYTKLCKYTDEVANVDRVYNRKIYFSESKYPAINKCIENFLNKTNRFPDFMDIMKLLESQSASLNLPSNKELIRPIAIEIFQQVGAMLQRRRKYDLWDSFCGFLDNGEDPADKDPLLNQALQSNFENRIKKEQEIFQHYSELQEKEKLEPEEVPDEEANRSPVESGNEDEEEIKDIENSLNRIVDEEIKKHTEDNDNKAVNNSEINPNAVETPKEGNDLTKGKETKNNYRNCKSLKWKLETGVKFKNDTVNSEDSNTGAENEDKDIDGKPETDVSHVLEVTHENNKPERGNKNESHLENKLVKTYNLEMEIHSKHKMSCVDSPSKRRRNLHDKDELPTKKQCTIDNGNGFDVFEVDDEDEVKRNEVFEVHCCQIVPDNVFEDFSECKKDWSKRRVFRDLTNVNRLMELHGRKRKMSGLYSPSFFHRSFFEFEKPSWKKRFKVSFKLVGVKGEKCALSQEDKTDKTVNADSGGSEKDIQNNSERTGEDDDAGNSFSSRGNGNEEDNNEDENKKNGKTGDEPSDHQHEEDDEEENENEKEDDNKMEAESSEPSLPIEKTEETSENKSPSANDHDEVTLPFNDSADVNPENNEKHEECSENPGTERETELLCSKEIVECIINELPTDDREGEMSEGLNSETENEKMNNPDGDCIPELEPKVCITESELEEEKPEKKSIKGKTPKDADSKGKSQPSGEELDTKHENKPNTSEEINTCRSTRKRLRKAAETENLNRPVFVGCLKPERKNRQIVESKKATFRKSIQVDSPGQKLNRRNTPSTSDEERVKRFLLHSPSSISITPPRKLSLSKPPSQAALQALATLRNLKGISATIVRGGGGQPRNEDDVVIIGDSRKRRGDQISNPRKRKRNDLPVISSIQSIDSTTPKIVTVEGNVSGFENFWPEASNNGNSQNNSSSIRISNVWGSFPNDYTESEQNNVSLTPSCSFRQNNPGSSSSVKKKGTKKTVEYVVLD